MSGIFPNRNAAITDSVCSLSPHHIIIEQPIIEAERELQRKWIYQNENESRRLTIRSLSDNI
ncbi:MAG TPA: hypothetical protein VFV86_01255 [Nitrososphaeraceae archaeon]|nr:hypothetical protein [Nitrososphaeraceae archaeon]